MGRVLALRRGTARGRSAPTEQGNERERGRRGQTTMGPRAPSSTFIVCVGSPRARFSFPESDGSDNRSHCAVSQQPTGGRAAYGACHSERSGD
ncbi:hypothetical protein ROHU_031200 [Labeo rohita]|uniref:Uncharacterized protein n=1 Tax=Labeo rohita TaxID=84645 RepID=A0A498LNT1_LABRO|nr:hypothetical protein ROHU_031200 [Labeo rohita]